MYSYEWDTETGGLILNRTQLQFSKEPRPVYYKELDILGFDKYWNYEKDDSSPYMWAEANNYIYRGRKVAMTKGGSCYTAPKLVMLEEPEPDGSPLRFIDVSSMVEKNREILESLVFDTIKKVYNTYIEYQNKIDVFYVAFSGGKDSIVTLDIVQRALPHDSFKVLFGDTEMEFPDTYTAVRKTKEYCNASGIEFIIAKSEFSPEYTWNKFGPPATVTRWCCSVHKTAPQILTLRNYTGRPDFTGMAFVGIRASESLSRSEYDYVSLGEKHKGQYSCNPILEWNSAEVYLYLFSYNLVINETYKKGNRRAGCLTCPRASGRNDFMANIWYTEEYSKYITIIKKLYKNDFYSETALNEFINKGGWKARKNGRDISLDVGYLEKNEETYQTISIKNPRVNWKIWIKTIGILLNDESPYDILFRGQQYSFEIIPIEDKDGYLVRYESSIAKENPVFIKLLKNVFRKSTCCIGCHECEADCHNGYIHMKNGEVFIEDKCTHCAQCHKAEKGCLVYKSLEKPKGGLLMSENKSLNCYSHHAPKMEWINQYFSYKNEFDEKNTLGSQMYAFFKRFLRDAQLLDAKNPNGFSKTAEKIDKIGLDEEKSWAIMLINLSYTPQINWFVKNISMNEKYTREYTLSLLEQDGAKESWSKDIWNSFGRFLELPFSKVGMGSPIKEKNRFIAMIRTSWQNPDPLVILFSLYKFAEACGGYYQFTLARLLDYEIESDGVSPTEIFGINREQMVKILNGLSINYPDFINASFTLDLDNITLNAEKTSLDILELI